MDFNKKEIKKGICDAMRCIGYKSRDAMKKLRRNKIVLALKLIAMYIVVIGILPIAFQDNVLASKNTRLENKKVSQSCYLVSKKEEKSNQELEENTDKNQSEKETTAAVEAATIANVTITDVIARKEDVVTSTVTNTEDVSSSKDNSAEDVNSSDTVEETSTVYYTVQRGDTLSAISMKYGTTVDDIARINNIQNVNLIITGQVIVIETNVADAEIDTVVEQETCEEELTEETEEQKIEDWANTPAKYRYTEDDVYLTACVAKAESGDLGDRYLSMQVFVNRQHINKTSARTELNKDNQYPTTRRKIDNGQITVTEEDLALAEKMLSGEMNGFENSGTNIPRKYWNKVYFQTKDPDEGICSWSNGIHYYALSKWIDNESNPYK